MATVTAGKHLVVFLTFYFIFYDNFWLVRGQDQRCSKGISTVNVTSSGGVLYSPGYPEEYHNSEVCSWILTSLEIGKVLQLRPLDLQVDQTDNLEEHCLGDVLVAYDGDSVREKMLHEWCGEDVTVIHSTVPKVLLQLRTNDRRRHRGFAMAYSLLTLADSTCDGDNVKTIPLGNSAVVTHFTATAWTFHSNLPRLCSWRVVADDVNSNVVIELENFDTGLPCKDGNFSVYDGPEPSSPEVIRWCARSTQPFSKIFLSGSQGMVVIRTKPNVTSALRFRFYTRSKFFHECSLKTMPTLELKTGFPTFWSLPFALDAKGESCPVRLISGSSNLLWVRVDLLQVEGRAVTHCDFSQTIPFSITEANETSQGITLEPIKDGAMCWRGLHPVYWAVAQSVIVSPSKQSKQRLLLKASPADAGSCHGRVSHLTAPTDDSLVIRNPDSSRSLEYSRSSYCRYVISGESETDHVLSRVDGELCELEDSCGDYVRIYDGPSTDSPLLYDSEFQNLVTAYVISTGRHVLYEISTDDRANRGFIQAEFNSFPGTDLCESVLNVEATRYSQNLSSVNYPQYYPVNYMCQYCITSSDPDDVIYIKVIDSDLTYTCTDTVEVYEGTNSEGNSEYVGRFCGKDTTSFVSKSPSLCLLFRSDPTLHGRGWLLSFQSGPPQTSEPKNDSVRFISQLSPSAAPLTTETIVLGVLLVIVAVALVIVTTVLILKTWQKERSEV